MRYWYSYLVSSIGFVAVVLGHMYFDLIPFLLATDFTFISLGIITISLLTSFFLMVNSDWVYSNVPWYIADSLISIGMVGTLLAFMFVLGDAFVAIDPNNVRSIQTAISAIASGMGTAIVTTITGLICSLWLKLQLVLLEHQ